MKLNFIKLFVLLGIIIFAALINSNTAFASDDSNLPTLGYIDNPNNADSVSGIFDIKGWLLDKSGVSGVYIFVDGDYKGVADYWQPRVDVGNTYPQYNNWSSGFQYSLDTRSITNGVHKIIVVEKGNNGYTFTKSIWIKVSNPQNLLVQGFIDSPGEGSIIQGIFNLRGWFLDESGVSGIYVFVDGKYNGWADYWQPRNDVGSTFPEYNNWNSGFKYSLDTRSLSDGPHKITVVEVGNNGNQIEKTVWVNVDHPSTIGFMDTPKDGSIIRGVYDVHGWFLDSKGVSGVYVFVDNQYKGWANYWLSRQDVGIAYPEYGIWNSGFQYSLDTRSLSNGSHKLTIVEKSNDGSTYEKTVWITVSNLPAIGFIDGLSNGSIVQGITNVNGWFLDGSGVASINYFVDGKYQGWANSWQTRVDVGNTYPEYENWNSGFQLSLDTRSFSQGWHTLTVEETGNNGGSKKIDVSIYVTHLPGGAIKKGIDIYSKKGTIDFNAVRNSGVNFVIAKASQGTTFTDSKFEEYINSARSVGLETHAYHYFESTGSDSDAKKEADLFAAQLKKVNFNGYAFIDVEINGSADVTRRVDIFLDELIKQGINNVGIYTYKAYFNNFIDLALLRRNYPGIMVWVAAYHDVNLGSQFTSDVWQYSDSGEVPGINAPVDMNYSYSFQF